MRLFVRAHVAAPFGVHHPLNEHHCLWGLYPETPQFVDQNIGAQNVEKSMCWMTNSHEMGFFPLLELFIRVSNFLLNRPWSNDKTVRHIEPAAQGVRQRTPRFIFHFS